MTDKGDTTTYEWIYGVAPLTIVPPIFNFNIEEETGDKNDNEIDYDIGMNAIDFNDENIEMGDGNDINWGDIDDMVAVEKNDDGIDYDLSLEESGIVVEAAGREGDIATGNDALTIIDNPSTRNNFIDQLLEVNFLSYYKCIICKLFYYISTNLLSSSHS